MYKFILLTLAVLIVRTNGQDTQATEIPSYSYSSALNRPYLVYKNPTDGFFYLGSVAGHADEKNGLGQVSVLAFENFLEYKLRTFQNPVVISSEYDKTIIDTPKGMVAFDDLLIFTEMDSLNVFKKIEKGLPKQLGVLKIKGAKNLHSIIKLKDDFYVTDSEQNGVFKITNLLDPEKREVKPLFRVVSPKGMIYDSAKNCLLIVSSKENNLYEYNLSDAKQSKTYTLAPPVAKDLQATHNGFVDLCIGNQKEIYLTNYANNKIMLYWRDEDRPATIKEPMKYAKVFLSDVRTPTTIIYEETTNRIIFTELYYNIVRFNKGLPPQISEK